MPDEPAELLEAVIEIARDAGRRIMDVYDTAFDVDLKEDDSPLTSADRASHDAITTALGELTPSWPILSEESALAPFGERRRWERFWLVDPLDGTKEFVKRNGEFTVNIALVDGHEPVLGVVVVPAKDVCYSAARAMGAFRTDATGKEPTAIAVVKSTRNPVRIVGSRSHGGGRTDEFARAVGDHEMVPMGSSIKLCLVADGTADVYPRLGPTSEWDTAAAQCVVECAGGKVIATDGKPLRCNTGDSVLNPEFLVIGPDDRDWLSYVPR